MVVSKRNKASRQRGKTTYGYGSMKKNRGAGNRGGVGNAGTGKRGDANKPKIWKNKKYFGMYGFTSKHNRASFVSINVSELGKYATLAGNNDIDLSKFKINKLLGGGNVSEKYNIIVASASSRAVEKIEAVNGKVTILSQSKEKADNDSVSSE